MIMMMLMMFMVMLMMIMVMMMCIIVISSSPHLLPSPDRSDNQKRILHALSDSRVGLRSAISLPLDRRVSAMDAEFEWAEDADCGEQELEPEPADGVPPEASPAKSAASSQAPPPPVPSRGRGRGGRSSGRGSGGSGKGQGGPGHKVQCQGCWKMLEPRLMPQGSSFCWADKRALDNIYRAAVNQGQKSWWMETRYNDEKRTRALKRYHQLHPEVADATAGSEEKGKGKGRNGRRTKGKGVFDVLQYIEETRVSVKVMRDTIKEEMTKQAFELHYMSKGYTAAEALVEWDNLMKDPESVIYQNKKGEKVIDVEVGKRTIYRDEFSRSRALQGADREIRNATQDQVDGLQRRLFVGMEQHGGASQQMSLAEVARQMGSTAARAGETFSAGNMAIGRVEDLLQDAEMADEAAGEEDGEGGDQAAAPAGDGASGAASGSAGADDGQSTAGSKGRWFDIDRAIATVVRKELAWISAFQAQITDRLADNDKKLEDARGLNTQEELRNEVAILKTRVAAVEKVIAEGPEAREALQQFIRSFSHTVASSCPAPAASASVAGESVTAPLLGKKPPSSRFAELVTVGQLREMVEKLYECACKEDLTKEQRNLKPAKEALTELSNMLRMASGDLAKAATALKKQREQNATKKRALEVAPGPAPARRKAGGGLFDHAAACGKPILCHLFESGPLEEVDLDAPIILRLQQSHPIMDSGSKARRFAENFLTAYQKNPKKDAMPRASRPLELGTPEVAEIEALANLVPGHALLRELSRNAEVSEKLFATSAFTISRAYNSSANEKEFMACFRLSLQGMRTVVAVRFMDVVAFMQDQGAGVGTNLSVEQVLEHLRRAAPDVVQMFSNKFDVFFGTVAPGEVFYLPSGYFVSEAVISDKDVCGLRLPFLVPSGSAKHALTELASHLRGLKKPTQFLDLLVEALAVALATAPEPASGRASANAAANSEAEEAREPTEVAADEVPAAEVEEGSG